jgi:DNA-binding response OmpR family regulator
MRILLVEDDPATAGHIKLILSGANFDVLLLRMIQLPPAISS